MNVAILIDGGFFLKRVIKEWGTASPERRADELFSYCLSHTRDKDTKYDLYRIFYYDCPPSAKKVYNPITKKVDDLSKSDIYIWNNKFHDCLRTKRKIALRFGKLSENDLKYRLKDETFKNLYNDKVSINNISQHDLQLNIKQKGVDMKIGLDIATLAYKKLANKIILISGDSDFVPVAKVARREGIDFVLDPLGAPIKPDLNEHIDGISTKRQPVIHGSVPKLFQIENPIK